MGKSEDEAPRAGEKITVAELAAQNADLRAKLDELMALVTAPAKQGVTVSPAELQRMLGVESPGNVRSEELPRHPVTGKPYFNDLRPVGR